MNEIKKHDYITATALILRENKNLSFSLSYRRLLRGKSKTDRNTTFGWKWTASAYGQNGYKNNWSASSPHKAIEKLLISENLISFVDSTTT